MFTKAVLPDTLGAIQLISKIKTIKEAYLAGGTSLALQIGHRISVDLDFFTDKKFNERALAEELLELPEFKLISRSTNTILGSIGKTSFSIFYYKYSLLEKTIGFEGIKLAGKKDIAAMKINALEDRGTKRDFIDVFFLAKDFSLDEMIEFYDQKYKVLSDHLYPIIRSLGYFADAEADEKQLHLLTDTPWQEVKEFFTKESMRLSKKYLNI
jgi:predicted nucleotidyltransferase component of viral defense system